MIAKKLHPLCVAVSILLFSCTSVKNIIPVTVVPAKEKHPEKNDTLLTHLLEQHPLYFDTLLKQKDQWRIQIIYTQVDRGANGKPKLTHHTYNLQPDLYFYPASTVKMPAAFLALQKLNELNIAGLDRNTMMITEAEAPGQTAVFNDPTSPDGRPTIAHYIKKIFLVSDNDAYNRLYEFLGQEYLNTTLHKMGYESVQLLHRLQISLTEEQNRTTNPVRFYDSASNLVYEQPSVRSNLLYWPRQTLMGNGYMSGDKVVAEPFDFSKKNLFTLADLHSVLQRVILPESIPAKQQFNLKEDYRFLYRYMSMKPAESSHPQYDSTYSDAYVKFLLFGGKGEMADPSIRIFNKVGDAYGFLQDVAYIVNFDKGVEFFLSATIYCNSDGIFNDDKYDYDTVGFPFLIHLGEVIYNYELQRAKQVLPDLSKFKFDYRTGE
jgi:hypothetical protein